MVNTDMFARKEARIKGEKGKSEDESMMVKCLDDRQNEIFPFFPFPLFPSLVLPSFRAFLKQFWPA